MASITKQGNRKYQRLLQMVSVLLLSYSSKNSPATHGLSNEFVFWLPRKIIPLMAIRINSEEIA